jgi:hypothetical protein
MIATTAIAAMAAMRFGERHLERFVGSSGLRDMSVIE